MARRWQVIAVSQAIYNACVGEVLTWGDQIFPEYFTRYTLALSDTLIVFVTYLLTTH